MPMYNVAVNLCTKMNDNRFTFILLFDCHPANAGNDSRPTETPPGPGDYLSLYAVRTFIDVEAKRAKDMLDHGYFAVICPADSQNAGLSPPKTYLEDYLLNQWQSTLQDDAADPPCKPALILPSIYCYFFDSASYKESQMISAYRHTTALADLLEERAQFQATVNNYMKTANLLDEMPSMENGKYAKAQQEDADSELAWEKRLMADSQCGLLSGQDDSKDSDAGQDGSAAPSSLIDFPFGFETHFYINPRDSQPRTNP